MGEISVKELIRGFQGELSLSLDDIRRLENHTDFLRDIANDINQYMEDNDIAVLSLNRADMHTQKILEIIESKL